MTIQETHVDFIDLGISMNRKKTLRLETFTSSSGDTIQAVYEPRIRTLFVKLPEPELVNYEIIGDGQQDFGILDCADSLKAAMRIVGPGQSVRRVSLRTLHTEPNTPPNHKEIDEMIAKADEVIKKQDMVRLSDED